MRNSTFILFLLCSSFAFSQSDFDRVQNQKFVDSAFISTYKVNYVFKGKHPLIKYNPVSLVFGGALLFYQGVISKQIMQGCAFNPSCSNFSKQCIHQFGIVKGMALSADRLTRCTRLSAIDFHPVLFSDNGKVNDFPQYYRLRTRK